MKMFMEGSGLKEGEKITKEHLKGMDWFADNHVGSTDPVVIDLKIKHADFKDLAGTLYAEGTAGKLSAEEAAGIYSVLENRAEAGKSTPLAIAKGGGVYGYAHRKKIDDPLAHRGSKQNAYKGLIMGMTSDKDYSGGGFFWHGEDFGGPRSYSRAHQDYYKVGFRFTNPSHDIWNLGDVKSGKSN
ncbi:hypothetical protein RCC89_14170 [Cytophagaceae bacterium ABcell3]|nr:hypothetical protein RCC89_14170 [Cytophagaceae bacterium ABcell3]